MKILCLIILLLYIIESTQAKYCRCGQEIIEESRETYQLKIVGGREVSEHRYPWMVQILSYGGFCGGSIINSRFILTAAHCVHGAKSKDIEVYMGTNDLLSGGIKVKVTETRIHKDFNINTYDNDIALLMLENEIEFNDTISPICLPDPDLRRSRVYVVAGWGETEPDPYSPTIPSKKLMHVTVHEFPLKKCMKEWEYQNIMLTHKQICAASIGRDTCGGDSGGPLMQWSYGNAYIVGIVSYGRKACGTTRDSVYTKIRAYFGWIRKHTKEGDYCHEVRTRSEEFDYPEDAVKRF